MKASKHENVRLQPAKRLERLRVRLVATGVSKPQRAYLSVGAGWLRCAIGRTGLTRRKREGDGATPIGRFRIATWRFQPTSPAFQRGCIRGPWIRRDDGWCDDPTRGAYNRQVRLPFAGSREELWRDDGKYAVIGVLSYNLRPRRSGAGSAIFLHVCDEDFGPTAGCVALRAQDLRRLLPRLSARPLIAIG